MDFYQKAAYYQQAPQGIDLKQDIFNVYSKNYDSSLKQFDLLYEPVFKDGQPELQIKNSNCLIRMYKNRYTNTHVIVKKLTYLNQQEWKNRLQDELVVFERMSNHRIYNYLNLLHFFIGKEGDKFIIYIITEMSRTLKGYQDYIFDKFSGFTKKHLREEFCAGCTRKRAKNDRMAAEIENYKRKMQEFERLKQDHELLKQKSKEQKETIDRQQIVIDNLEKKKKKRRIDLKNIESVLKNMIGDTVQLINDHKRQVTDLIDINDNLIASCEETNIKLFDVSNPGDKDYQCIQTIEKTGTDKFNCLMMYDAVTLLVGLVKGGIQIYDKFQYLETIKGHNDSMITGLYLSDLKGEFYTTHFDGKIISWDFPKRKIKKVYDEHTGDLSNNSIIFVGDSRYFISVSMDKMIKLWDNKQKNSIHTEIMEDPAFSIQNYDDTYFITGHYKKIKVWRYISKVFKQNYFEFILGDECHKDVVFDIQMVNTKGTTGQFITGSTDTTVKIWHLDIGKQTLDCLKVLEGHTECVTNIFLREAYVFSSSVDSTIRIWE